MGNYIANYIINAPREEALIRTANTNSINAFGGDINILLLGLPNAGKTTVCYAIASKLEFLQSIETLPTIGSNFAHMYHGGYHFIMHDVAGNLIARKRWLNFLETKTDVVIWVIDLSDPEAFDESIKALKEDVFDKLSVNLDKIIILYNKYNLVEGKRVVEERVNLLNCKIFTMMQAHPNCSRLASIETLKIDAKNNKSDYMKLLSCIVYSVQVAEQAKREEKDFQIFYTTRGKRVLKERPLAKTSDPHLEDIKLL